MQNLLQWNKENPLLFQQGIFLDQLFMFAIFAHQHIAAFQERFFQVSFRVCNAVGIGTGLVVG